MDQRVYDYNELHAIFIEKKNYQAIFVLSEKRPTFEQMIENEKY